MSNPNNSTLEQIDKEAVMFMVDNFDDPNDDLLWIIKNAMIHGAVIALKKQLKTPATENRT